MQNYGINVESFDLSELFAKVNEKADDDAAVQAKIARGGFKHHTAICEGHMKEVLREVFTTYLSYDWVDID